MAETIGLAMLSFAHVHARGYADQIDSNPDAEITAVWDDDPVRGKLEAGKRGVPFVPDLDSVLGRAGVQGVVVNAPTALHPEIIIAAAQAGKHIFTEKALAITTPEANRIVEAVQKAGVKFMISLPSRVNPHILFAKKVLDEGLLGEVTMMRARVAHSAALDKWFQPEDGHSGSSWFGDEKLAGGGGLFRPRVSPRGCHALVSGRAKECGGADEQLLWKLSNRRQYGRRCGV